MQPWPTRVGRNSRTLGALRMFALDIILKSVYIVLDGKRKFYVNNYSK